MITLGIYDSGIGGLTTLIKLEKLYDNVSFFYLADNLSHPFGNKTDKEIKKIVDKGIERLKDNSDIQIVACNTASTIIDDINIIKLLPPLNEIDNESLLLCTEHTYSHYKDINVKHADTHDLASMIEVQLRRSVRRNSIEMNALLPYIAKHIFAFRGVKKVILGCSHYPFCKQQIDKVLRGVEFVDGNKNLIKDLDKLIEENEYNITKTKCFDCHNLLNHKHCYDNAQINESSICKRRLEDDVSRVKFAFTGNDEVKFYRRLLTLMCKSDLSKI